MPVSPSAYGCLCAGAAFIIPFLFLTGPPAQAASADVPASRCAAGRGRVWEIRAVPEPSASIIGDNAARDPEFQVVYPSAIDGQVFESGDWQTRFRVFYQQPGRPDALRAADILARLYCYGRSRLAPFGAFLHPTLDTSANDSRPAPPVPLYLDESHPGGGLERQDALYLLDVSNLKDPVEFFRELAHEYSHLTVPGIRGFIPGKDGAEDFANGFLGEVLYAGWFGEDTEAPALLRGMVGRWSQRRARGLETTFLRLGALALDKRPYAHFWEYEGMLLYLKQLYGMPLLAGALGSAAQASDIRNTLSARGFFSALADTLAVEGFQPVTVPGDLAIPINSDLPANGDPAGPAGPADEIRPQEAVRTWVYLKKDRNGRPDQRYAITIQASGVGWDLRAAQLGVGGKARMLEPLHPGSLGAIAMAGDMGWFLFQWRNTGTGPAFVTGWTWTPLPG